MKKVRRIFLILFLLFAWSGMFCVGIGLALGGNFRDVSRHVSNVSGEISHSFWANNVVQGIANLSFDLWMPEKEADCASFSNVKKLLINVSGTLEVLEWDGETIDVESYEKLVWLDEDNGTLTIADNGNSRRYHDSVTKISIPSGYFLDKIVLVEAELVIGDELRADTVVIDRTPADITIECRLYAWFDLEVHADGCNVTIERAAYTPMATLSCNSGNLYVTFEAKRSDYNISTLPSRGNVTVDGAQVDENPAYGPGKIRAKCNMGNIDIGFSQ